MPSVEQQKHWIANGINFGYPICCVVAFCSLEHLNDPEPRQLEGTGYVPCKVCNDNLGMLQLIASINAKRHPSLKPFPQQE